MEANVKQSHLMSRLGGLGVLFLAVLGLLSIVARESMGVAGQWVGDQLFGVFGWCSVLLPLGLAAAGVILLKADDLSRHSASAGGYVVIFASLLTLLGLVPQQGSEPQPWAGIVGVWIASVVRSAIGLPGTILLSACLVVAGSWLTRHEFIVNIPWRAAVWATRKAWAGLVAAWNSVRGWFGSQRLTRRTLAATQSVPMVSVPAPITAPPLRPIPEALPAPVEPEAPEEEPGIPEAGPGEEADEAKPRRRPRRRRTGTRWVLPPPTVLAPDTGGTTEEQLRSFIDEQTGIIDRTLQAFHVEGKIVSVTAGARVIMFEWQPAPGVKANRLEHLADDLTIALKAERVRVVLPLPGKGTVGIEIPHPAPSTVTLGGLLGSRADPKAAGDLPMFLGRAITGEPLIADLVQMPHLLIAGTTGSGKSVCIHAVLSSLFMTRSPDELRLILIDPKRVEMMAYRDSPHLVCPVMTEAKKSVAALRWVVGVMEARYRLLARYGCRDLHAFNRHLAEEGELEEAPDPAEVVMSPAGLPWIVVAIDELADLMVAKPGEVEDALQRIAQMARGVGIHLVVATQRPSVDVLTGVIKANMPSRIAFQVATRVDSRTILDEGGADQLLGKGDMLYWPAGAAAAQRAQGAFLSSSEVTAVIDHWTKQGDPDFLVEPEEMERREAAAEEEGAEDDPLYDEAVDYVIKTGEASVSMLQRRLSIGFARAGRLIDLMERRGVVGPKQGSKPREIVGSGQGGGEDQ